jgi:diaminohydroxyphosphoribosylaminopyrimidine deaminase/5-amino-6-(5-phosphoribosylamino)uracil reductase
VLDSGLRISPDSDVVRTAERYPTLVYHCRGSEKRCAELEARGVSVLKVRAHRSGRVDIRAVLADLASRGVLHLFVEGGGVVASAFLRRGLVDKLVLFVAPRVLGDLNGLGAFSEVSVGAMGKSYGFRIDEVIRVGPDLMVKLYP